MQMQEKVVEIKKQLEKLANEIPNIFENKLKNIETDEIKDKLQHFCDTELTKTKSEIQQTIKILESPIYVGLLGKYSHGKTALVNALFSIDDSNSLPEGKGIVTSKITSVEFDKTLTVPKCFEHRTDRTWSEIDMYTLKENVSGRVTEDNSLISYYQIKLPTKDFSGMFEKRMIHLIDMPGLGGPYYRDSIGTHKYVSNIDMLLVTINIDDIDGASRHLEPYIQNTRIPVIPVLTFFRTERQNKVFAKCSSDEDVMNVAKDELSKYLPSLAKHFTKLIAVDSKNQFQIDVLREIILSLVENQNLAIEKMKNESPEIIKRKIREITTALQNTVSKTNDSVGRLENELNKLMPEKTAIKSFDEHFKKQKEKALRDAKGKIGSVIKNIFSKFKDRASDIRVQSSFLTISTFVDQFKRDVNTNYFLDLKDEIESIFADIKDKIGNEAQKYINNLELGTSKKEEMREDVQGALDNNSLSLDNLEYEPPQMITDALKAGAKTVAGTILGQLKNPQTLIPLAIGICLIMLGPMIPPVGKYMVLIGAIMIAADIVFCIFLDQSYKKQSMLELKEDIYEKLIGHFDKQTKIDDSYNCLQNTVNELLNDVNESLDTNQYGKDVKSFRTVYRDFQSAIQGVNENLQKEIEKAELWQ